MRLFSVTVCLISHYDVLTALLSFYYSDQQMHKHISNILYTVSIATCFEAPMPSSVLSFCSANVVNNINP